MFLRSSLLTHSNCNWLLERPIQEQYRHYYTTTTLLFSIGTLEIINLNSDGEDALFLSIETWKPMNVFQTFRYQLMLTD